MGSGKSTPVIQEDENVTTVERAARDRLEKELFEHRRLANLEFHSNIHSFLFDPIPFVLRRILPNSNSLNSPVGIGSKQSTDEVSTMKMSSPHELPDGLPPKVETLSEMGDIHNLNKAKLAAGVIIELMRDLGNSEDFFDRKRALDRISIELTIIREVTNGIDGKNIVDQKINERSNDVITQVEMIKKCVEIFEEILLENSSHDFERSNHRLMEHARKLKDLVDDWSMEYNRALVNKEVFEKSIEPTTISTPVIGRSSSSPSQNLSNLQKALEKFCNDVIQFSKQQFKTLKLPNTDGSKAYTLSHFLKIESDILNFQMKTALESLKSFDSELEKPIFGQITSEMSHDNQKIIEAHLESMKRAKKEIILLKSSSTSTAANVISELAFWVLSFQNSNEELLSMGIKPIFGEDDNSFDRQKVNQIICFLFGIQLYESFDTTISSYHYAISLLLGDIERLRVADYSECFGEIKKGEEAIAGTSSQI
ncbi:hypothetical protein CRE_16182 [Caenorhabditis remanei]|uniref:Uncharacterized protein n=1 Tax=Caenorhabditis remanei TaxID=31234 RepID=E3MSG6_CAERE|nr:hypothetical protein CRE_16182 [Caenorhabditis remanei]